MLTRLVPALCLAIALSWAPCHARQLQSDHRQRVDDAIPRQAPLGVLFDDPALRASLLDFIKSGKGVIGIHDAIATFVQWPVYDQWPEFGRMNGGTENGGHPWNGELMTMRVEDRDNPVNAAFGGKDFEIADQAFQLQEPVLRDGLHVLLSIDPEKSTKTNRKIRDSPRLGSRAGCSLVIRGVRLLRATIATSSSTRRLDTIPGARGLRSATSLDTTFQIPCDAQSGQTIHVILEASDRGTPSMTRYQRVIVTVVPVVP